MDRDPITKQRSEWQPWATGVMTAELIGVPTATWIRNVHDGYLRAFVAEEPLGWHLSISFVDKRQEPTRYPTWDEIAHARELLLPSNIDFVLHLPSTNYVAVHKTTFHLHEHPERKQHDHVDL